MFVRQYVKGQEEDVLEECAKAAVRDGAAKPVEDPKVEPAATEPTQPGKPGEPEGMGRRYLLHPRNRPQPHARPDEICQAKRGS